MADNIFDVILVGGGIMGCASAYYLKKTDNRLKVAIIEMDPTYTRASTPLSDGNIRVQFNIKENILMSLYGLEVLDSFAEDMAVGNQKQDIAFRRQGNLFLVDADGRVVAERGLKLQNELGCQVDWLTPERIEGKYPFLNLEKCVGGTLGYRDGTMDPYAVLIGYKNKAVSLGVEYIKAEVTELLRNKQRISGVRLHSGDVLRSNIVVNTAGAWASRIAQTLGIDLPIEPTKRQVFVLETNTQNDSTLPAIIFPSGLYLIHERGGCFMCGKSLTDDPTGYDDFSWDRQRFTEILWPELVEFVAAFDRLKIVRGWAGLYEVNTLDGNAILGEWLDLNGFFLANGFSGHGFQQCHAVGRYLTELILGLPPSLDLSIFSPKRIIEDKPVFEGRQKLV